MSNAISTTLEKLLFDYETVILPGLGGFTTNKTSATVDYAHGTLQPPSKSISFNENLTVNDGLLVQRLCRDYSMTAETAQDEVEKYVESTRVALDQREIITLAGVGRLYKNYAQKVQFLPDQSNFNSESYGLPPLQFSPIMRSREVKEAAAGVAIGENSVQPQPSTEAPKPQPNAPQPAFSSNENWPAEAAPRSTFMQKALPWLVAFGAMAVAATIYFYQKTNLTAGRDIVVNEQTAAEPSPPIATLPILGSPIPQPPEPKKNVAPPVDADDEKTSDDDSDAVNENDRKKAEALRLKEQKAKKYLEKAEKPTPKVEAPAAKPEIRNPKSEIAEGRRAVIVVGTYRDKTNANRILDLLKKNGWNTYFRNDKGWQVGIETTYQDFAELKKHLNALEKQTGESNIWIKKK